MATTCKIDTKSCQDILKQTPKFEVIINVFSFRSAKHAFEKVLPFRATCLLKTCLPKRCNENNTLLCSVDFVLNLETEFQHAPLVSSSKDAVAHDS